MGRFPVRGAPVARARLLTVFVFPQAAWPGAGVLRRGRSPQRSCSHISGRQSTRQRVGSAEPVSRQALARRCCLPRVMRVFPCLFVYIAALCITWWSYSQGTSAIG